MFILAAEAAEQVDLTNWQKLLEEGREALVNYAPRVGGAVVTLIIGWLVAKMIRGVTGRVMRKAKVEPTLATFALNILYSVLMVFVVISALGTLGVRTDSFVAIIGAAGLAIGFALQGSLSNFAAGVMLVIFKPFKQGDLVEAGGVMGKVREIQIFSTIIDTQDNRKVIVPNSQITGGSVTNYDGNKTRRVDMVFGIGYSDDIDAARTVIAGVLDNHPKILETPAYDLAVRELADSSVNFVVRPWCSTADYWTVWFEVHESVKKALDAAGISIPFPQQDVHMHQVA